jgi:hypothetical protein
VAGEKTSWLKLLASLAGFLGYLLGSVSHSHAPNARKTMLDPP